jgi:hypothetical protein
MQIKLGKPAKRYLPEIENATLVIPHEILDSVYSFNSLYARISNKRHDESSEPVPNTLPLGKNVMALRSDVCPENVLTHRPVRTSHSLARESQAPETKMFLSVGDIEMLQMNLTTTTTKLRKRESEGAKEKTRKKAKGRGRWRLDCTS